MKYLSVDVEDRRLPSLESEKSPSEPESESDGTEEES